MWQIAEFKCSEMWSGTAAPNHLHKEGFWSFSFSSHLPGIPYFLCPDRVAGDVRGLWYMGIIFGARAGGPSLTAAARFLIWYNFQTLCSRSSLVPIERSAQFLAVIYQARGDSRCWIEWFFMHHSPIQVMENDRRAATCREQVRTLHFFNAPWASPHEDSPSSRCCCSLHLNGLLEVTCQSFHLNISELHQVCKEIILSLFGVTLSKTMQRAIWS